MIVTTDQATRKNIARTFQHRTIHSIPEEIEDRSTSSICSTDDWYVVTVSEPSCTLNPVHQLNDYPSNDIEPVHAEQITPIDSPTSFSTVFAKVSQSVRSFVKKHSHLFVGHYDFTRFDRQTSKTTEPVLLQMNFSDGRPALFDEHAQKSFLKRKTSLVGRVFRPHSVK